MAGLAGAVEAALITPFEVAFLPPTPIQDSYSARPITFTLNRIVDTIFVTDVVLAFFMPYRQHGNAFWVHDHARIARHYLKGWFTLDVATCIPFDLIFGLLAASFGWSFSSTTFRLLRMLRITKIARAVRASRIFARWQDHIGLSFAYLSLIRFLLIVIILAH